MPNKIFIISGPSGSGQDSIIEELKKILPLTRVITTTTRPKRPGEKSGRPYYFVSRKNFLTGIAKNKFLEYAKEYNDNYYGVTFSEIQRIKKTGKIGIWKIEYQGVTTVKKIMPEIVSILITAPLSVLEKRIKARDKDKATKKYLSERMAYTKKWLKHKNLYDYEVANLQGKLPQAVKKTSQIIKNHLRNEG